MNKRIGGLNIEADVGEFSVPECSGDFKKIKEFGLLNERGRFSDNPCGSLSGPTINKKTYKKDIAKKFDTNSHLKRNTSSTHLKKYSNSSSHSRTHNTHSNSSDTNHRRNEDICSVTAATSLKSPNNNSYDYDNNLNILDEPNKRRKNLNNRSFKESSKSNQSDTLNLLSQPKTQNSRNSNSQNSKNCNNSNNSSPHVNHKNQSLLNQSNLSRESSSHKESSLTSRPRESLKKLEKNASNTAHKLSVKVKKNVTEFFVPNQVPLQHRSNNMVEARTFIRRQPREADDSSQGSPGLQGKLNIDTRNLDHNDPDYSKKVIHLFP